MTEAKNQSLTESQHIELEGQEITAELVTAELYRVYLRCMQEVPVTAKDKETGKQVPTGVYQFDSRCALKALQLLGNALGVFKDKGEGESGGISYEEMLRSSGEYEL